MNLLDRTIGFFSPERGLRRVRSRAAMGLMARSYDGAKTGRRTDGWVVVGTGANAEIGVALNRLRDRSRDLVRNNPYAAKAVQSVVSNLVGTGIQPRARDAETDDLWARWCAECDADGMTDFYGLQALVTRTIVESGECLVRLRDRRVEDGLSVPLQLQVLEPDHLDIGKNEVLPNGAGEIVQGVQFGPTGRREAYWLFARHPGESGLGGTQSRPVAADSVLHLFDRQRPGQVRGVPWFAPVIMRFRDLDEYDEAEIVRKKVEACLAAFVTGPDEDQTIAPSRISGDQRVENFEPGMVAYLPPGKDVKFNSPAHAGGYAEYMRVQLHAIAAGVGLTYELLTGDLSQVNYSSIRAGLVEFRRRIEALQWQMMVPGLCAPVWNRFARAAQASGALSSRALVDAEWTAPRFEAVDPLKDIKADIMAVRAGFMTLPEAIARQGYDPAQVLSEIAETNGQLDAQKIVLDTDPRRVTQTGAITQALEGPADDD